MDPNLSENEGLPAIEIENLTKLFGQVRAVDDLSFTMNQCEIFGLLGPNGSGKTTTINMVSGLTAPTSGEIRVMGFDLRTHTRQVRQILGAVPQETALYEELSAWANMDFHADLFGIPVSEKKERITKMLELVQLIERKDSRVNTYSGGMKRRLALARALLHRPSLIYLDEPTLGVDVQSRRAIWDYILALRKECRSILITTNYLEEAQVLCDRIAILDHGKLIAIDTPDGLKRAYGGSVVELETARPLADLSAIRQVDGVKEVWQDGHLLKVTTQGGERAIPQVINLVAQVEEIRNITVREPNLDEVFLHLTGTGLRD
jgi:ABC-2 type transport system ATP-binding protein